MGAMRIARDEAEVSVMDAALVRRSRSWAWVPVGLFAALVGIVIALGLVYGPPQGPSPWFPFFGFWVFLWIFVSFGLLRWFLWPAWGYRWGRRGYWRGDDAVDIARARYARGEITKEQFEALIQDLSVHDGRRP
jgi:uncharacterized membrane protein